MNRNAPKNIMEIKRSNRKTLSIEVTNDARIIVRAPYYLPLSEIKKLVEKKSVWIETHIKKLQEKQLKQTASGKLTAEQIKTLIEQARQVIPKRVEYFSKRIQVTYGHITIRNQKTLWGSCSGKGNLNFNCLLMLAPPEVLDYVIVHELCHRREMNHSKQFWREVEKVLPDYQVWKKWLKEDGEELISKSFRSPLG